MIGSFLEQDSLHLMNLSPSEVVDALTIENVKDFLISLGVSNIIEKDGELICPTICHNPIDEAETMKLYWYQNYKLFHCYTECADNMSIFTLYRKYMALNQHEITFEEAVMYVKKFVTGLETESYKVKRRETYSKEKYYIEKSIIQLDEYNENAMDCFVKYHHPLWLREGITDEVMDIFNIRFSILDNKIIIPHYDINGHLVGIRGRALNQEEVDSGCKYMPIQIGDTMYAHQLHFNLYGIWENQNAIRKYRRCVLFEGEKSVMLDKVFYGDDSVALAVCGSKVNKYQINMLTKLLGVNDITIAFDKEYNSWKDADGVTYRKKLMNICKKYSNYADFYYIFDDKDLTGLKDAPVDKGKEVWEQLYSKRNRVR